MKKMNEFLGIETWKTIAKRVQKLQISDCSEQEFSKNLKELQGLLSDLDICIEALSRDPQHQNEVGLASLLQAIYNSNRRESLKKDSFYEKIYQLSNLGIQNIRFLPVEEYYRMKDIVVRDFKGIHNGENLYKVYTDGTFSLEESLETVRFKKGMEQYRKYHIKDLKNANYIISVEVLKRLSCEKTKLAMASATLKTLDGVFPSQEELMRFSFPELTISKQIIHWGDSIQMKEKFDGFDTQNENYQKQLQKDRNV